MSLKFPADWTEEMLERYYQQAKTPFAAQRYQALLLCVRCYQRQEAAAIVGVSRRTLQNWIHQATLQGLESLNTQKHAGGYPAKLSMEQQAIVDMWVLEQPHITLSQLQRRIAHEWHISLSLPQIAALLAKLDYRRIIPRKRHYQAEVTEQEAFKKKFTTGFLKLKEASSTYYLVMRPGLA